MSIDTRAAWDQANFKNPAGAPLFMMPPSTALGFSEVSMSQRFPEDPTDVDNAVDARKDAIVTTTRIGPSSGRSITSSPIHIANMCNIASVRLARTFRQHVQGYNEWMLQRHGLAVKEAPPLVSLPKQLTEYQTGLIVEEIGSHGDLQNIVLTVGSDSDSRSRMDNLSNIVFAETGKQLENAVLLLHYDNPNLNSPKAFEAVSYWRKRFPDTYFMAGNTDIPEVSLHLASLGVDAVKIGIGPGAMCTTRLMTGIGIPQVTAVAASVNALRNENGDMRAHVVADGGVRNPKDWIYALALGASDVMFASIFAGSPEGFETDADLENAKEEKKGVMRVPFFGSASSLADNLHYGNQLKGYRYKTAEGRAAWAELRMPDEESGLPFAVNKMMDFWGGLRGAMTFRGVGTIEELQRNAQFIPISGPHVDHSVNTLAM